MNIKLKKFNYSELDHTTDKNPWILRDLALGNLNLIVGKNAVGKTRTTRVIFGLANMIARRAPLTDGTFNAEFEILGENNKSINYELVVRDKVVVKEVIKYDDKEVLNRNGETKILSYKTNEYTDIKPPKDALVLYIRRDEEEYPFFEYLINWAKNTRAYKFGNTTGENVEVPMNFTPENIPPSLQILPTIFDNLSSTSIKKIISDFNSLGYDLIEARTNAMQGSPVTVKFVQIKEKDFKEFVDQPNISQGMYRAFALLSIIQYNLDNNKTSMILVDDLGEGLDYERASKLAKVLYEKMQNENIQFVATSNDIFLMNCVDIKYWNILKRDLYEVRAFNYSNSKEVFEHFKLTGLTNFDIFSSTLLSKLVTPKDEK